MTAAGPTLERLRRQLAYLADRSAFYRRRLGDLTTRIRSIADLRAIDYTTKDELRLSQERAEAVRRYLVRKGVSARRLTSQGYGPDRPLQQGTSEAVRAKNRRVQFVVVE